jgi:hypothetical protein
MKKIGLRLIVLVLFIPVITYADNEGPGARGLQWQIDRVQPQMKQIQLAQGPAGGGGPEDQMSRRQTRSIGPTRPVGPSVPFEGEGAMDRMSRRQPEPVRPTRPAGPTGLIGGMGAMDELSR